MKGYFKYFLIPFIVTAVITIGCLVIGSSYKATAYYERYNNVYDNTVCVYDWAGKMTEDEVYELNERILYWQEMSHVDIAFITMDSPELGYLEYVKDYADQFSYEYQMGYNKPIGDSVVFVDNWSRGGDGKIHTWISTRGERVRSDLTDDEATDILYILDEIPSDDSDPYAQYCRIVDAIGEQTVLYHPPYGMFLVPLVAGLIAAVIFILINWRSKLGDVTVNEGTYLKGSAPTFPVMRDEFVTKTVTKTKIESSSSSGGGGGGGSTGGGGHSR